MYENKVYLLLAGSEELCVYNLAAKDKVKRIKGKVTVGRISLDRTYLIYAEGNDWTEGLNDLKKNIKPKIGAVKMTRSELEAMVK
jgi:hypothetical protein